MRYVSNFNTFRIAQYVIKFVLLDYTHFLLLFIAHKPNHSYSMCIFGGMPRSYTFGNARTLEFITLHLIRLSSVSVRGADNKLMFRNIK